MNINTKFIFGAIIVVMGFGGPINHVDAKLKNVYWGGVGFSGSWDQRTDFYPQSSKLLCLKGKPKPCPLDTAARKFFAENKFSNFKFNTNPIPSNEPEALVGVISISGESLGIRQDIEKKENSYIHIYRIFSNFLIYEVGSGKILHSIPVILRHSIWLQSPASDEKSYKIVKQLLTSDELGLNLFKVAHKNSKDIDPHIIPGKFVQITNFQFSQKAAEAFQMKNPHVHQGQFAQFFEGQLVASTGAHMNPSASASVISGRIKATFENGEREMTIPPATVKVEVLVRLAKLFEKIKGPQKTVCHAVALTFKAAYADVLPDEIEEISQLKFAIFKDSCGVTDVKQKFPPNYYFSRSLFSLLQNMAGQFGAKKPDKSWLGRNARGNKGKDVAAEIIKVRKQAFSLNF